MLAMATINAEELREWLAQHDADVAAGHILDDNVRPILPEVLRNSFIPLTFQIRFPLETIFTAEQWLAAMYADHHPLVEVRGRIRGKPCDVCALPLRRALF